MRLERVSTRGRPRRTMADARISAVEDLYQADILPWSRRQAAVLRGPARRRDLPSEFDLDHVAEEIEDVGRSELAAVQSFIRLMLVHAIKAACARSDEPKRRCRSEIINFHNELLARLTGPMRKDIDLDLLWSRTWRQAQATLEEYGKEGPPFPDPPCPFGLDDLTGQEISPVMLAVRLERSLLKPRQDPDRPEQLQPALA